MRQDAGFLALALSLLVGLSPARAVCPSVEPFPYPEVVNGGEHTTDVCHDGFALKHDDIRKVPLWVEYVLTRDHAFGCKTPDECLCLSRTNTFREDKDIKKEARASKADYAYSGYDRGHNAPAGDMAWDKMAQRQSFYFSNMTPQLSTLNSGPWRWIEQIVRAWAATRGDLLIVTGPIFDQYPEFTRPSGVAIPKSYYKVIYDPHRREALSLIVPQTAARRSDLGEWLFKLEDVQRQSGISPLPGLPVANETTKIWPYEDDLRAFRTQRQEKCPKELPVIQKNLHIETID